MGIESTLRRARSTVFWPGITSQIKDMVQQCPTCCSQARAQPKETLMPHPIPTYPWKVVGVDLFSIDEFKFVISADYLTGYWEVDQLQDTTAPTVIMVLKRHFARYGTPKKVISDNGSPFSSVAFSEFAKNFTFKHWTSSPGYPASNGRAECSVKVAKSLIRKALLSGRDPWIAVLEYRNTPQECGKSPAQKFFGHSTRGILPASRIIEQETRDQQSEKLQVDKERVYYDRSARDLTALERGDVVRIQPRNGRRYEKGVVIQEVAP